jgi:apolipoprotein N-acyltransferase
MLRATTNGISALVDEKGRILQRSAQFRTEVIRGEIQPRQGSTPYVRWGNSLVIVMLVLLLAAWRWRAGKH